MQVIPPRTPIPKGLLQGLVDEGLTQRQIADRLGKTRISVRHWLRKHRIRFVTKPGPRRASEWPNDPCLGCGEKREEPLKYKPNFCSLQCFGEFRARQAYDRWLAGDPVFDTRSAAKRAVVRRDGWKCSSCHLDEWLGEPIPLEVDHINGVANDHRSVNLRLLCPNCHAMTETYKGKKRTLSVYPNLVEGIA